MSKKLKSASSSENVPAKSDAGINTDLNAMEGSSVIWLKKIYEVLQTISDTQTEILQEIKKTNHAPHENTNHLRKEREENWETLLNKRKHAYYHKLRSSEIKTIYSTYLGKEPPFIPVKFRESVYPGISAKQKENKSKLEKMKLEIEIDRLNEEEEKNANIIEEVDASVKCKIAQYTDISTSQQEKEKWIESVNREESKSREIWEKKKQLFTFRI